MSGGGNRSENRRDKHSWTVSLRTECTGVGIRSRCSEKKIISGWEIQKMRKSGEKWRTNLPFKAANSSSSRSSGDDVGHSALADRGVTPPTSVRSAFRRLRRKTFLNRIQHTRST